MESPAVVEANGNANVAPATNISPSSKANDAKGIATAGDTSSTLPSKPPNGPRINYAAIHARPLPLHVHPLPPLIPHNPLSLLYITFTFLKQLFLPPTSHVQIYRGYFSPDTRSVHVTEEESIRGLWESGFFGKGTLSRSEPTWLQRERRRLGIDVKETAEEITARRREERKAFKAERARKEKEERDRQHRMGENEALQVEERDAASKPTKDEDELPSQGTQPAAAIQPQRPQGSPEDSISTDSQKQPPPTVVNQEHLQIELVEAFFLVYALGVLAIYDSSTQELISTTSLFHLCIANAHFPPLHLPLKSPQVRPDNSFLVSYAAYHHFRSLGWVVRSGVKFAVDLLLYPRGPVFAHAEFAVTIVPSYTHTYWQSDEAKEAYGALRPKPWHVLHMVNRVQAQVRKTLVLCFVNIPPPLDERDLDGDLDVAKLLRRYSVREMVLKRWVPNRNRD